MNFDNIPQELKVNGLWCAWKLDNLKGKVPYDVVNGNYARSNDKSTFHGFQQALHVMHKYYGFDEDNKMTGGLGLGIFNGYSAIDIDNCRNPETGELNELASDIIEYCGSYTEISPSKTGIRILLKTKSVIDKKNYYINNTKLGLEIYISENTNKFVTITGDTIYPNDIREVNLDYLLDEYMRKVPIKTEIILSGNVDSRIQKALNKDKKLIKLWNMVAPGRGSNESEIDLALCNKLAFYVDGDYDKINQAFIESPFFKSKDDAHKNKWMDRDDYREMTIEKSIHAIEEINDSQLDENDLNDTGNAQRLIERFGDILRFNVDNGRWVLWNSKYWQTDIYNNVKNFAEIIAEEFKQQAMLTDYSENRKMIYRNVKRILSSSGKMAMLKEAEHISGIPITNADFDIDPHLLNCEDGVIDLRTGTVYAHDKKTMLSKMAPYQIVEEEPKRWLKFLDEIFEGDQDIIDYMHKVVGYGLTAETKEQAMFILVGDGANGKSLFLEIMNMIAGSYGANSNVEILLEKRNNTQNLGDVARLNKIRNVVTDETKIGDKLNESAIKTMTSGIGKIVARFLYGNEFEFTPVFKIFMATNHKPVIRGTDHGIWRRLKLIPFNRVFEKHEQDKELITKLKLEIDGIFTWAVKGAKKWYAEGLREPAILDDTIREYRTEMDIIQQWVDENCDLDKGFRAPSKDLFENFTQYATMNKEFQMSQTLFGRNMAKKFQKRRIGGAMYYEGLRIKADSIYYLDKQTIDDI